MLTDFLLILCPDLPSDPRHLSLIATHHLQLDISRYSKLLPAECRTGLEARMFSLGHWRPCGTLSGGRGGVEWSVSDEVEALESLQARPCYSLGQVPFLS